MKKLLLSAFALTMLTTTVIAEPFYKKEPITVLVIGGEGGLTYGMTLAFQKVGLKYAPKMRLQIMNTLGGLKATNYMAKYAPRDGTYIIFGHNGVMMASVFRSAKVKYKLSEFGWLGGLRGSNFIQFVSRQSGIKSLHDATKKEVFVGASFDYSMLTIPWKALNIFIGTKFKIIKGYRGAGQINAAIKKGELAGKSFPEPGVTTEFINKNFPIVALTQTGSVREVNFPNTPLFSEIVPDKDINMFFNAFSAIGKTVHTTPGVSPTRLQALRELTEKILKDLEFIAIIKVMNVPTGYISPFEMESLIKDIIDYGPAAKRKLN